MLTIEVRDVDDSAARAYMEKLLAAAIEKAPELRDTVSRAVAEITGGRPADVHEAIALIKKGISYDSTLDCSALHFLASCSCV
jgi:hypothetical protein